jgi:hypothetical protein
MKFFDEFVTGFFIGPAVVAINFSLILCKLAKIHIPYSSKKFIDETLAEISRSFIYFIGTISNVLLFVIVMIALKKLSPSLQNYLIVSDIGPGLALLFVYEFDLSFRVGRYIFKFGRRRRR